MTRTNPDAAAALAEEIAAAWEGGPGGAVALFDRSGPTAAFAGGLASLEHAIPFAPGTPNRWASVSKMFGAATALRAGLSPEDRLGDLVPGLPEGIAAVTLRHALGMTGGLPDLMELLWQLGTSATATMSEAALLRLVRRLPGAERPPGREMVYSNTGWRLLSPILQERGEPYGAALRRHLLEPLGLGAIADPEDESEPVPNLATGYWRDGGSWRRGRYGQHLSPSGGLAGSVLDLAGWGAALLAGRGPLEGMLQRLAPPPGGFYGLGLARPRLDGLALLGHGGSLPGVKTQLLLAPAAGWGAAIVSNREETDALGLALRLIAALTGTPPPEPARLPPGLYAEETGEAWAEAEGETLSFMGASHALVAAPGGGARTLPSTLDLSLRVAADGALEGSVGGVSRRLLPVPESVPLDASLVGSWREERFGAPLRVEPDGSATLPGEPAEPVALRPLPGGRALAERRQGPWRLRPLLHPGPEGTLRLATHRARCLVFRRA